MKLVECVPNVSEGRDRKAIETLAAAVTSVEGVQLLDTDPGAATNRTVFTFVGHPEAAAEAAFALIRKASELIDMRGHHGEHPRIGATDVCPFVPLEGIAMEECVALARALGRRVGEELGIPVYLYEAAASRPDRRSVSDIRAGEYEGLAERMRDPAWAPDFGPRSFNARSGATVIGARPFLIAYNVSLNTRDKKLATIIAQNIRETGRPKRGKDGRAIKDAQGRPVTEPGPSMLPAVRATGWYIEEYGRAQVSINLADFRVTPPHAVFDAVVKEAEAIGLRVTGSEVVGLIPLEAVRMAGRHALARQGKSPAAPEPELVHAAVLALGLSDVVPFDPDRKIIEYRVAPRRPLGDMTVRAFADAVSSTDPAPGGGSVAALTGALGASLAAMVAALTYERQGMETLRPEMEKLGLEARAIQERLLSAVDDDTRAFQRILQAGRLPRRTEEERLARAEAMQRATLEAIDVPMAVMRDSLRVLEIAAVLAARGLASARSDAGVAARSAAAAVAGAHENVLINLPGLDDPALASPRLAEAETIRSKADDLGRRVADQVRAALSSP